MTAREDTIERIERVLNLTHPKSITVTIPRLSAERAVSMLKEQEAMPIKANKPWNKYNCPACNAPLHRTTWFTFQTSFCKYCGQAVKWE